MSGKIEGRSCQRENDQQDLRFRKKVYLVFLNGIGSLACRCKGVALLWKALGRILQRIGHILHC
jgi:hypothetical protein